MAARRRIHRDRRPFEQRFTFVDFGRSQIWSSKAMSHVEPGVRDREYRGGVSINASRYESSQPDFCGIFGPSDYSTRIDVARLDCVIDDNHLGARMGWRTLLAHLVVTGIAGEHYEVPPGGGLFSETTRHCEKCRKELPEHDDEGVTWTADRPMRVIIPARQNFFVHLRYTADIEVPIAFLCVTLTGESVEDVA